MTCESVQYGRMYTKNNFKTLHIGIPNAFKLMQLKCVRAQM